MSIDFINTAQQLIDRAEQLRAASELKAEQAYEDSVYYRGARDAIQQLVTELKRVAKPVTVEAGDGTDSSTPADAPQ